MAPSESALAKTLQSVNGSDGEGVDGSDFLSLGFDQLLGISDEARNLLDEDEFCQERTVILVEEFREEEDLLPRRFRSLSVNEVFFPMSVSKEDLEDLSRLLDLDERKPTLLLFVGIRESKDIVEDRGDRSKVVSSSGEEDSVRGLNDEVCFGVEGEVGVVGRWRGVRPGHRWLSFWVPSWGGRREVGREEKVEGRGEGEEGELETFRFLLCFPPCVLSRPQRSPT